MYKHCFSEFVGLKRLGAVKVPFEVAPALDTNVWSHSSNLRKGKKDYLL